jgi:hypothetical protein
VKDRELETELLTSSFTVKGPIDGIFVDTYHQWPKYSHRHHMSLMMPSDVLDVM